jgi:hypothetical protein
MLLDDDVVADRQPYKPARRRTRIMSRFCSGERSVSVFPIISQPLSELYYIFNQRVADLYTSGEPLLRAQLGGSNGGHSQRLHRPRLCNLPQRRGLFRRQGFHTANKTMTDFKTAWQRESAVVRRRRCA